MSISVTLRILFNFSVKLLRHYVTARKFAMSSAWLEQYKKAHDKNVDKSKGLKNYVGVRKDCTRMS